MLLGGEEGWGERVLRGELSEMLRASLGEDMLHHSGVVASRTRLKSVQAGEREFRVNSLLSADELEMSLVSELGCATITLNHSRPSPTATVT